MGDTKKIRMSPLEKALREIDFNEHNSVVHAPQEIRVQNVGSEILPVAPQDHGLYSTSIHRADNQLVRF